VRIRKPTGSGASPVPGPSEHRNGRSCPRCKRFGTFAPNSIVCDRCLGTLPLIFVVTITVFVTVGGGR
jgi:hypothetical protein